MELIDQDLGADWDTINAVVLTQGRRILIDSPSRFADVDAIRVDEPQRYVPKRELPLREAIPGAVTW